MGKIEKFENIESRKTSRELVNYIYKLTNKDSFSKDRGLKDQVRRASVSILSNIAEGFERNSDKEFKQFLFIAKGSCAEVRAQLYVSYDQKYIDKEEFEKAISFCVQISKLLSKFITYLNK